MTQDPNKPTTTTTTLPKFMAEALTTYSNDSGISKTRIMTNALKEYFKKHSISCGS